MTNSLGDSLNFSMGLEASHQTLGTPGEFIGIGAPLQPWIKMLSRFLKLVLHEYIKNL